MKNKDNKQHKIWSIIKIFVLEFKVAAILAIVLGVLTFLFYLVLELFIPNTLQSIDQKTTLSLFDELQKAHRHQDAILLMESRGGILNDSYHEEEYKIKLHDSYMHVGDFSKAEKMLLDVRKAQIKHLSELDAETLEEYPQLDVFLQFTAERIMYQFYETIGDSTNQIKYFNIYKRYYDQCKDYMDMLQSFTGEMPNVDCNDLVVYDSAVVKSFSNIDSAIEIMKSLIEKIIANTYYNKNFKLRCLTHLIKWQLDSGKLTDAYISIATAVGIADNPDTFDDYAQCGILSDYCYQIHDIATSKYMFSLYNRYLEMRHQTSDYDYINNQVRSLRYLESDGNYQQLIDELVGYCKGMRRQIATNLPSMTEDQREFFAAKFDMAYNYAFHILQMHPDDRLADLCFDNVAFKNGLLLRSNRNIENSIKALGDSNIDSMYSELKELRLDLIYQSVSGKKITNNTAKTESRIDFLEKEIALKCTDFKTKNDIIENDFRVIQSHLKNDEAVIELIEYGGNMFALILGSENHVKYVSIGSLKQYETKLRRPIFEIYHDESFTKKLWGKIADFVEGKQTLYYVPVGFFNQLSLCALYAGDGQYLSDLKDFRLLSNPSAIMEKHQLDIASATSKISLWGGIDYGFDNDTLSEKQNRAAIYRGDTLCNLKYAYREVSGISEMLTTNNIVNTIFTDSLATEKAFKNRAKKCDKIIHISTHGFFNDRSDLRTSMTESGLFFAGANKYWCNDTISIAPNQEDGILRAAEIAEMNLSGCSLVVLSACETGLGYSNSSEGVYGLQRAFKLAGADMVLMSLWKVDDYATSMLMTEFYKNLLSGDDANIALDKSRKTVREKFPSPEDWGGFVLLD